MMRCFWSAHRCFDGFDEAGTCITVLKHESAKQSKATNHSLHVCMAVSAKIVGMWLSSFASLLMQPTVVSSARNRSHYCTASVQTPVFAGKLHLVRLAEAVQPYHDNRHHHDPQLIRKEPLISFPHSPHISMVSQP